MNKYNVYICLILILSSVMWITEAGSRKRYRKNKKTQDNQTVSHKKRTKKERFKKNISTHIDTDAYQIQSNDITPINEIASIAAKTPATTTGMPQMMNKIEQVAHQYDDPFVEPKSPAVEDKTIKPIEIPFTLEEEDQDSIELNFENADLQNFVKQIEDIFEVTFITDDALSPLPQGKKAIKNNKISFKTNQALSKKEAWNLFITFLDIAGFAIIPQADPRIFRITMIDAARKSPLPTFIGVDASTLPDTDELIRYVYFLENASVDTIMEIINPLRSSSSQGLIALREHKGFILTDKAYNIKMLMTIVKELDKVSIPESMSVLKLRNANAEDVQRLYQELLPKEEPTSRFFTKKQPTSLFFPENTRIIADPRTNTLILLGPTNAIRKIEEFIVKYIDLELDQAYSPLYTYQLKFADARTIADIMTTMLSFGRDTAAGQYGGVRGTDQYMRPMSFIAEPFNNRLIIRGHYEDYIKAHKVIAQLDEKQPQAAIEVLIATVDLTDTKSLGAQIRSKQPGPNGLLGNNIKFQTSGLYGTSKAVTNPDPSTGAQRLLGNLISLVTGAVPGTSLLTLGADAFGVWGIFEALQTITDAEVVSNPFILATNNAQANIKIGEERRIVTAQVVGTTNQNAFDADDALLNVAITPQINSDGMINLNIEIEIDEFTNLVDQTDATKNVRKIRTNAIVANKEVLALGGLIRNNIQNKETKVPILGDIPILGWFFKNKRKVVIKQSLLVLISTRIIESNKSDEMKSFNRDYIDDYQKTIDLMEFPSSARDPIHRAFFNDKALRAQNAIEGLIFERHQKKQEADIITQTTEMEAPSPTMPDENQEVQPIAHKNLIETMRNKKRTQLSLAEFLHDKEVNNEPIY